MLHIFILSGAWDYFTFINRAAMFQYFGVPHPLVFFADPASLDFFHWEVWLYRSNSAYYFTSNTMNILPIDQQLVWLFTKTYKNLQICATSLMDGQLSIWNGQLSHLSEGPEPGEPQTSRACQSCF